jgi:small subunit ribosomal protein S8
MDAIANALTIIRNAQAVNKEKVKIPFSSLVWDILKVMKKEGFIDDLKKKGRKLKKTIEVKIRYRDDKPFVRGLEKVSKQGQRIYISSQDIRPVRNGFGRMIISTSKGVMTGREAKRNKVGGEFLCKIW